MPKLILVRHGQSLWNAQNRFTGWVDVPLTEAGKKEASNAAAKISEYRADVAYTSALVRAQHTLQIMLDWLVWDIPVIKDKALNERDYGDLVGLNKAETALKFGDEQVHIWRRSFDTPPPNGEALKNTAERTLPFFERCIMGDIRSGSDVLVVAHGNSNRSIVMELDGLSGEEIMKVEIPTGVPIVYDFDEKGNVVSKTILE